MFGTFDGFENYDEFVYISNEMASSQSRLTDNTDDLRYKNGKDVDFKDDHHLLW